ncbi:MAG: diguanylate cyclase, partial [Proteobacteria bacterium]|nr:diguanylate cyclase [Pseudomonadota bacterium]
LYPQDATDADMLLRHADQAMYQAKQAGKNRYHMFDFVQDAPVLALIQNH